MHGSVAMAKELVSGSADVARESGADIAVFPPAPYLDAAVSAAGGRLAVGGQTLSEHASGAYTGEVSASMLTDLGCNMVLVGHSERRSLFGESDAQVAAKFAAAQDAGLTPILCVGESLQERESGQTESVVARQVAAVIDANGVACLASALIAYEPVWAIGTGKTASPQQAQDVHAMIRQQVSAADATIGGQLRILYGGSVKGSNANELFAMPDVDGGLVGGASLTLEDFAPICRAAAQQSKV